MCIIHDLLDVKANTKVFPLKHSGPTSRRCRKMATNLPLQETDQSSQPPFPLGQQASNHSTSLELLSQEVIADTVNRVEAQNVTDTQSNENSEDLLMSVLGLLAGHVRR